MTFQKVFVLPPHKSEQSITLNLKEFVPPAPPVAEPVVEEVPDPPVPEEIAQVQEIPQEELQEMTKRLFEKIANFQAKENNATKLADEVVESMVKKEIKEPKKEPVKEVKKEEPKKKEKPKKIVKKIKKVKKPKKIVKKKIRKKRILKKRLKNLSKDPLANAIMNASTSLSPSRSKGPAMRMIKQFYGTEFNSFAPAQKKFIEKNLGSIYRITQRTLTRQGYPEVAARTHQQGTQIVTFYLHPNGAISGLRLKKRIGYTSLDENTIEVIRIAYKDYPRPKTTTKITFYVEYSLY